MAERNWSFVWKHASCIYRFGVSGEMRWCLSFPWLLFPLRVQLYKTNSFLASVGRANDFHCAIYVKQLSLDVLMVPGAV